MMAHAARRIGVHASAWLLLAIAGCDDLDPCGVPGIVEICACNGGAQGARVCTADKHWGDCDCSGAIALPGPVRSRDPQAGVGGAGGAGGTGGSGARPGSGTGGAPPVVVPEDDAGAEPQAGSGGSAGDAGPVTDAAVPVPRDAYGNCATASDCQPDSECIVTPSFPMDESVCAPPCAQASDCPVPNGNYDAVLTCEVGYCRLDCTPVLFAPLLQCPPRMTCIAPLIGQAYCHANGM